LGLPLVRLAFEIVEADTWQRGFGGSLKRLFVAVGFLLGQQKRLEVLDSGGLGLGLFAGRTTGGDGSAGRRSICGGYR